MKIFGNKSNSTFSITKASKKDIDNINNLEKRIFTERKCLSRSQLRYLLSSKNASFFLLHDNNSAIGYGVTLRNKLRNGRYKGRIYYIGVVPAYKNHGAGSLLLNAMEESLIQSGVSFIVLETFQGQGGAELFFMKHGYAEPKVLPNYYPDGDGVRLKKIIANK